VSRVTLEVQGDLQQAADAGDAEARATLAALQKTWAMPSGTPFRNPAWAAAKTAALLRLRAAGYASATWSGTAAEVDAPAQQARLFLVAESGPLYRFGELAVEGLAAQDAQTVRNLAGLAPGTPMTEARLLDFQERLQKAGLFDVATVILDPDPEKAAHARVVVTLREAPLQVWTFGVGVSANTGPRASVEHTYRRVFGYAMTARNKLEWGRDRQAWDGEISTHPDAHLYRTLLGGAIERLETDADVVLSQRVRFGRSKETPRVDRLYYVETERSERSTAVSRTDTVALSANYHLVWRRLDSILLPTRGYSLSLQGGVGRAHGSDSESGPFTRLYGRLTGYLPIGAWYGTARVELGQVVKRDAVAVPESQLFRAGGDDSVRGYDYRSLGPIVAGAVAGGTSLLTASVELARPFSAALPSFLGAVFVDAGNAANGFDALKPALGYGVGVRWRSPVGPLRVDLAYGQAVRQVRLHVSVGIAF
jgi:translocation and assembly module TamA